MLQFVNAANPIDDGSAPQGHALRGPWSELNADKKLTCSISIDRPDDVTAQLEGYDFMLQVHLNPQSHDRIDCNMAF